MTFLFFLSFVTLLHNHHNDATKDKRGESLHAAHKIVPVLISASADLTPDLTVLSRDFAVKMKSDFRAKRRHRISQIYCRMQIRRIHEQLMKVRNKNR